MVAPLRTPRTAPSSPAVRQAYQLVADTLLTPSAPPTKKIPTLPAWKAWLFAAWVIAVAAAYFAHLVGAF